MRPAEPHREPPVAIGGPFPGHLFPQPLRHWPFRALPSRRSPDVAAARPAIPKGRRGAGMRWVMLPSRIRRPGHPSPPTCQRPSVAAGNPHNGRCTPVAGDIGGWASHRASTSVTDTKRHPTGPWLPLDGIGIRRVVGIRPEIPRRAWALTHVFAWIAASSRAIVRSSAWTVTKSFGPKLPM